MQHYLYPNLHKMQSVLRSATANFQGMQNLLLVMLLKAIVFTKILLLLLLLLKDSTLIKLTD